jgi:hypothetical protein
MITKNVRLKDSTAQILAALKVKKRGKIPDK